MKLKDEVGSRYGSLTVLGRCGTMSASATWNCVCDCGRELVAIGRKLRSGATRSCKPCSCLQGDEAGFRSCLLAYRRNAENRGLPFDLSIERFRQLTKSNCWYCNLPPSGKSHPSKKCRSNVAYEYTGIDRVDNTIGYVEGNVAPCCKACNMAKGSMRVSDFVKWLNRISKSRVGLPALENPQASQSEVINESV